MEDLNRESKYIRAKQRVDELKKFYGNLTSYIFVVGFLAVVNYLTYWEYKWFLWVAFGWGIGVIAHAIGTFRWNPFFNKEWEERKIREFMEEDQKEGRRWE